ESNIARPVNCVIMRFSNVYGSQRDLPERVVPKFMNKALRGEDLALYGGEQILDFTFIDDTVFGIMKAYSKSLEGDGSILGEAFHFVTGRGVYMTPLQSGGPGSRASNRTDFEAAESHRRASSSQREVSLCWE